MASAKAKSKKVTSQRLRKSKPLATPASSEVKTLQAQLARSQARAKKAEQALKVEAEDNEKLWAYLKDQKRVNRELTWRLGSTKAILSGPQAQGIKKAVDVIHFYNDVILRQSTGKLMLHPPSSEEEEIDESLLDGSDDESIASDDGEEMGQDWPTAEQVSTMLNTSGERWDWDNEKYDSDAEIESEDDAEDTSTPSTILGFYSRDIPAFGTQEQKEWMDMCRRIYADRDSVSSSAQKRQWAKLCDPAEQQAFLDAGLEQREVYRSGEQYYIRIMRQKEAASKAGTQGAKASKIVAPENVIGFCP